MTAHPCCSAATPAGSHTGTPAGTRAGTSAESEFAAADTAGTPPTTAGSVLAHPLSRRHFFAGMAAVTGTVLWSTRGGATGTAHAQEGMETGAASASGSGAIHVGRAMADITGEPLGAGMNGYAVLEQTSVGLQRRQYARAFVFVDPAQPSSRLVHVTADVGLMFQSIFLEVVRRVQASLGTEYGEHNILLHATHTHVAPGGTSQHAMVDITTLGFRPVTFEATVSGIVDAIIRAHHDVQPAELTLAESRLSDCGVNRSRQAFDANPEEDRAALPEGVDPRSVTLHVSRGGRRVGLINWFSVHPTSFPSTYRHISGDNKGYAAWATEDALGVNHRDPASAHFVAAFANATPGDITPNLGLTPESGPGRDGRESAQILGERMMGAVVAAGHGRAVGGAVGRGGVLAGCYRWVDCANLTADGQFAPGGTPARTGPAILGAAFAASSQEDGGGEPALNFQEGARGGTPWVKELTRIAVPEDVKRIHWPKEVLLPLGYIDGMIQQVHPFYIQRIGALVLVALGFEPTVTSGLRLRRTVAAALNVPIEWVIVQGYTNSYGHYITTPEEYDTQNYEGGATIFGRAELPAFQQVFDSMARSLAAGEPVEPGRAAGDLTGLIPASPAGNPWVDVPPLGRRFGQPAVAEVTVRAGENASLSFVGANPNNNLRHGDGYMTITNEAGEIVAHDSSESTLITFRTEGMSTTWIVDWGTLGVEPGTYTVTVRGDARALFGQSSPFEGSARVIIRAS